MIGPVDLADAQRGLAFGAGDAHLALVVHAVGGVGLVFVREGGAVPGGMRNGVVAAQEPETAVVLVPRDRTLLPELGVDRLLVEVELVGVMVEVDNHVGADVWAGSHRKVLQRNEICGDQPTVRRLIALSLQYYAIAGLGEADPTNGRPGCPTACHVRLSGRLPTPNAPPSPRISPDLSQLRSGISPASAAAPSKACASRRSTGPSRPAPARWSAGPRWH